MGTIYHETAVWCKIVNKLGGSWITDSCLLVALHSLMPSMHYWLSEFIEQKLINKTDGNKGNGKIKSGILLYWKKLQKLINACLY